MTLPLTRSLPRGNRAYVPRGQGTSRERKVRAASAKRANRRTVYEPRAQSTSRERKASEPSDRVRAASARYEPRPQSERIIEANGVRPARAGRAAPDRPSLSIAAYGIGRDERRLERVVNQTGRTALLAGQPRAVPGVPRTPRTQWRSWPAVPGSIPRMARYRPLALRSRLVLCARLVDPARVVHPTRVRPRLSSLRPRLSSPWTRSVNGHLVANAFSFARRSAASSACPLPRSAAPVSRSRSGIIAPPSATTSLAPGLAATLQAPAFTHILDRV